MRVKDVGTVVDGYEERTSTTRLNGADAVSFSVRKQSGANTVDIATKIEAALARLAPELPAAADSARSTATPTASARTSRTCAATSSSAASWPC